MKNEMKKFKARCSSLGDLRTDPRTKAAKEAGEISQTSKTMVSDKWLQDTFGFRKTVFTKEMFKGITGEQDSMTLASSVLGGFRMRHAEQLENEWLTGTPDIVLEDCVEDIKTSWDLRTFMNAECSKAYESQLRGYMMLTGKKKARLIYCLIPTPPDLVQEEVKSVWFKFGCDDTHPEFLKAEAQINLNHSIVSHIPEEDRVKVFEIDHNEDIEEDMKTRVERCRYFYNTLTL